MPCHRHLQAPAAVGVRRLNLRCCPKRPSQFLGLLTCSPAPAQTAATTAKVGDAMAKANAAMAAMGETNDPRKVAQTMQQFQKENAKMEMGQEMMDDTLDGVFDDDEVEGETDDLMNQVSLPLLVSCPELYYCMGQRSADACTAAWMACGEDDIMREATVSWESGT